MSFKINYARYLLFAVGVVIGLLFFISLNSSRRQEMEALGQVAFQNYLESNLYSMSTGYFQWDEFQNAVDNDDTEFVEDSFGNIMFEYPFVSSIQIEEGVVKGFYEISESEGIIYGSFSVFNSDAYRKSEKIIVTEINIESMLTDLYDNDTFYEINHNNGSQIITLKINEPLLNFGHYVSAIMIGIVFQLAGVMIHRQTIRNHYQLDGLKSILNLLSKRDFYTADHSEEVAELAIKIAQKLEFPRNYVAQLYAAGILHDIGKVGINDAIINKEKKLTDAEWEALKEHPQLGYEIVSEFPGLEEIALIVKQHHEKLDGSGYPEGLKAWEISTLAQILSVADIYSAMKSDRPYRPAFTDEITFKMMRQMPINQEAVETLYLVIQEED